MSTLQEDLQAVLAKHIALAPHKLPALIEALSDDSPIIVPPRSPVYTGDRFINVGADRKPTTDDHVAIYDQESGLTWARAPIPVGTHGAVTAAGAGLALLGFTDWKVASVKQIIAGPVDYTRFNPVLDKKHFDEWPSGYVWTSTPDSDPNDAASCAFVVVLVDGDVLRDHHDVRFHALAVRAGQQLGLRF